MHVETLDLRQVIVFLVAAGIVVPLVRRLGMSPVFGFLTVGLAVKPPRHRVFDLIHGIRNVPNGPNCA